MNFNDPSHNPMMTAFGWTLIHSLWQLPVIVLIAWSLLRFNLRNSPEIKYVIACSAMIAAVVTSAITFIILVSEKVVAVTSSLSSTSFQYAPQTDSLTPAFSINTIVGLIQSNMEWVIFGWMIGAGIFSFRVIGGWWYVNMLRSTSVCPDADLEQLLKNISIKLGVKKFIALAESSMVGSPVVIGYLRPMIIFPAGLISGLTTAQIETILLHELAHIRRHDYLINIIQSFIEVIFFFNPFIWMLSDMVRREREFCCDDTVLKHHGNAVDYARTLAFLEETRISGILPVLSLADNKNDLLIRIKRIMEKSLMTENGNNKFLPFALIILGLVCASWLTLNAGRHSLSSSPDISAVDTTVRKNKVERKIIQPPSRPLPLTASDPAPVIHLPEEIEQNMTPVIGLELSGIHKAVGTVPVIPVIPEIDPDIYFNHNMDTVPQPRMFPEYEWEKFSEAFELKFRERFGEFFEKNEEDLNEMLSELRATFHDERLSNFRHELLIPDMPEIENAIRNELLLRQEEMKARQKELGAFQEEIKARQKDIESIQEDVKIRNEIMREQQQALREDMEKKMKEREINLREVEKNIQRIEEEMKNFENILKEELIKDGYLSPGENISDMKWDDKGNIVINGTRIRDPDKGKYKELRKKFFERQNKPLRKIE